MKEAASGSGSSLSLQVQAGGTLWDATEEAQDLTEGSYLHVCSNSEIL